MSISKSIFCVLAVFLALIARGDHNRSAHSRLIPGNSPPGLEIRRRPGYVVGYDPAIRQARWVAYRIKKEDLTGEFPRDRYRFDPNVTNSSRPADYSGTGFDRGHMATAQDMAYEKETMRDSFLMSNFSPQTVHVNRGVWARIERFTREAAKKFGEVSVVMGPIFEGTEGLLPSKQREIKSSAGDIPVPGAFFKVLYTTKRGGMMLAFVVENEDTDPWGQSIQYHRLARSARTAAQMARLPDGTEFKFFPNVDPDDALGLRDQNRIEMWW